VAKFHAQTVRDGPHCARGSNKLPVAQAATHRVRTAVPHLLTILVTCDGAYRAHSCSRHVVRIRQEMAGRSECKCAVCVSTRSGWARVTGGMKQQSIEESV
jgi:hypothetical protein